MTYSGYPVTILITADEMMFSIALGGFEDVPDESNFKANIYEFTPTAFD